MINWWKTTFGDEEAEAAKTAVSNGFVSQGEITQEFERELARFLGIKHVIATCNGSSALILALMAAGVKPGGEVIVPNRTWIATAHAARIIGAEVILVDVEPDRPCIDAKKVLESITSRTQAVIGVHLNGRAADVFELNKIAKEHGIPLIEDAAQALGSRNRFAWLGTQSLCGCFSLSVAKTIATGQGGFVVTNDSDAEKRIRAMRTHGVENVKEPQEWLMVGSNFRFTDVAAAIGLVQLKKLPDRLTKARQMYEHISGEICNGEHVREIPLDANLEIPVYNEFLFKRRDELILYLEDLSIDSRRSYPNLCKASYFNYSDQSFPFSKAFESDGLMIPSGPSQEEGDIDLVVNTIKKFYGL